ncbi:60S acidic ribosomal protein [Medicago truncatula]|uniref:60S acidic ribosomal protein n=1 Tax=Medicago truncatula TaxID=3880 RepID=A0A072UZJ1_MEDTR|nr:60S acidic ribosomal protein [Medicago truncatula]
MGNVGLIFTKGDLKEVSEEEVAKYKVEFLKSQTSFFQVLNIPTKINKGIVKIITLVELIKKGDKGWIFRSCIAFQDPSKLAVAVVAAPAAASGGAPAAAAAAKEEAKKEEPEEESDEDIGFGLFGDD